MKVLLDSYAVYWWTIGSERLSDNAWGPRTRPTPSWSAPCHIQAYEAGSQHLSEWSAKEPADLIATAPAGAGFAGNSIPFTSPRRRPAVHRLFAACQW